MSTMKICYTHMCKIVNKNIKSTNENTKETFKYAGLKFAPEIQI